MLQELAFKDPTGRVYMMRETEALPPLAQGYEWTMVVRPDGVMDQQGPEPSQERAHAPRHRNGGAGFLDLMAQLLTPREGQSAKERAQELVDVIPEDVRSQIGQLVRALTPRPQLPPFPGM